MTTPDALRERAEQLYREFSGDGKALAVQAARFELERDMARERAEMQHFALAEQDANIERLRTSPRAAMDEDIQVITPNFVELLDRAKDFIGRTQSLQIHPLRDTHANDVPVTMARFAAEEIGNLHVLRTAPAEARGEPRKHVGRLPREQMHIDPDDPNDVYWDDPSRAAPQPSPGRSADGVREGEVVYCVGQEWFDRVEQLEQLVSRQWLHAHGMYKHTSDSLAHDERTAVDMLHRRDLAQRDAKGQG